MPKRKPTTLQLNQKGLELAKKAAEINFPSQADLAAQTEVNKSPISRTTVSNFLSGKPVQKRWFLALCKKLKLNPLEVTDSTDSFDDSYDEPDEAPEGGAESEEPGTAPATPAAPPTNLQPYRGIRNLEQFVGREEVLKELHQLLQNQGKVAICSVAGMGGLGKTELAIQYVRRYQQEYPRGIIWLEGNERSELPTQIISFTQEIFENFIPNQDLPATGQVSQCWRKWQTPPTLGKLLVVVDDLERYDEVKAYLPDVQQVRILITTRLRMTEWAEIPLKVLELPDALALLRFRVGEKRMQEQPEQATRLCEWMGRLPLGLELVGHFLANEPNLSLGEMMVKLEAWGLSHDAMQHPLNQPFTAERGVAAAFELSWQKLDEATQRLGGLLSLFAAASIPWQLVEMAEAYRANLAGDAFDGEALQRCRHKLRQWHLLEEETGGSYRLHALIRQFFRGKCGV